MNYLFESSKVTDGNMSLLKGDASEAVENRKIFLSGFRLGTEDIVEAELSHSTKTVIVSSLDLNHKIKADALISSESDLALLMLTGDCIPLSLVDPVRKNFALVHCSWDTLDAGIIENVISGLAGLNTLPEDLYSQIGPSIGPCCYLQKNPRQKDNYEWKPFIKAVNDSFAVDLWGYTIQQLCKSGINKENIENLKLCTYHSGNYFSHHKYKKEHLEHDYRFATILKLK